MSRPLVVLDVAGLTPPLLPRLPAIAAVGARGFRAELGAVLPAVAPAAQSTFLTGLAPRGHGIVGDGWYDRELGEVLLRRQHRGLVGGEPVWVAARRAEPGYRVANVCWEFALGAGTDLTVAPAPGGPGCYTTPAVLRDRLQAEFGPFPDLRAVPTSPVWIAGAARHLLETDAPDLTLVALPHLDVEPDAIAAVDAAAAAVVAAADGRGATVVVLSGHGLTRAARRVDLNGLLRREGLLTTYQTAGGARCDLWASRAFAVVGAQVAHVYVRASADVPSVAGLLAALPGVDQVLDAEGKRRHALDHPRSGELVAVAQRDTWFTSLPGDGALAVHGRLPDDPAEGPVLLCSDPAPAREWVAATEVRDLLLATAHLS